MRTTLADQARVFARRPTPWLLFGAVVGGAALRFARGPVRSTDLVVAATVALAQPFVEWLIHVNVLHAKAFRVFGRTVDVGASHRLHHAAPRDLGHVFVDVRFLAAALGAVALVWAAGPGPLLGTVLVVAPAGVLAYEWTHFLVHTAYAPKTALYRRIRRAHLLHHFRDERAWFGVTTPVADLLLGTYGVRTTAGGPRTASTGRPSSAC